jgi:hypothetical protein
MANNTFVGFPNGQGESGVTAADTCHELQPITTWDRQGYYTITRRWRGPIDALKNFSQGGVNNKDHDGTYLSGANGIIPGGAGRDGAIKTDLQRDEGGQTGIFSATWVTSDLTKGLGTGSLNGPGALTGRGLTSVDQYQESSIWELDGNDLEKNVYESDILKKCETEINADATGAGNGFSARVKEAIENYLKGIDGNGDPMLDPYGTKFDLPDYFGATSQIPLSSLVAPQASVTGGASLYEDLQNLCKFILQGQESFTVSQYVLRNTKTTQYTSSLLPHYANVNRIWTTANITTLMAGETRPIDPPTSTVANTLPLLGVIGSTAFATSKWLYRTPDVKQLGNGKWQITKEWFEGDEINTSTYKAYGVT